jgi:hypothetical protein
MEFLEAKKILNKNGKKYTDEEIEKITKLIGQFVKIDINRITEKNK